MRPIQLTEGVSWVGVIDWNCRNFHGYSQSPLGTTYNAFLVEDEKTVLLDTVEPKFKDQFFCGLKQALKGRQLDYVVVNHLEPDHAGCLEDIVKEFKPEKIICSPMGIKAMRTFFDIEGWPVIETVKSGEELCIGKRHIQFIETRMLHWPDNMITYIPEEKMAFCSDAFGQNIASSERYADEIDRAQLKKLMAEYYANIVLPYSKMVKKIVPSIMQLGIEIETLCPDHGLIFRGEEDVRFALESYLEFAEQKPAKKAVIAYDTMWQSTEKMAIAIADGLMSEGISVKVMNVKANHHSTIMSEVFDSAAVVLGSPTHNNGILPGMANLLTYMKGLRPEYKIGASFGSFGWSGECVNILSKAIGEMHMEEVTEAVKVKNRPTHDTFQDCFDLGVKVGKEIKKKWGFE
ncbi:MAG: FprA family A-type flavoprotein [Desulfovibrio sp.]